MKEESVLQNASFPYTNQADPQWIQDAIACGYTAPSITREECLRIREKTGIKLPRWLMKDPSRRITRGSYACPELEIAANQKKA